MRYNMLNTIKGSLLEDFYPAGWDLEKIHNTIGKSPEECVQRESFWHDDFEAVRCADRKEFYAKLGYEIAAKIKEARDEGYPLACILPVGPMEQYDWVVYYLKKWNVKCDHLYCFNMDEWSDAEGNTIPGDETGSFEIAMKKGFYDKLGELTVPVSQRNFATKDSLPHYYDKIKAIKDAGGKLMTVYGVGRDFHVAFWEPHFAGYYESEAEWKSQNYAIGAKLHPLSIEQNAILSFQSDFTSVPCRANTIGPGLFLMSDYCLGGVDALFDYGAATAVVSLWCSLHYGPTPWIPSSYMPTMPGKFFFLDGLAQEVVVSEH